MNPPCWPSSTLEPTYGKVWTFIHAPGERESNSSVCVSGAGRDAAATEEEDQNTKRFSYDLRSSRQSPRTQSPDGIQDNSPSAGQKEAHVFPDPGMCSGTTRRNRKCLRHRTRTHDGGMCTS
ncbi:hypothetical protein CgunFtcFv8_015079 [Champsocephalus gunnari]|uniref:Uncharacterized protein n=1 Tax=Champsocephalus gunnari TaxID=52237 RepID=A0AAN8EKV8_CHAGU|nr:hypothetical protein CgunFtcFv8_015079 [Champsocephalus gunnari]